MGPLDPVGTLGELVEIGDVREGRVHHERREAEPGRPTLGEGRRRRRWVAVHHLVAEEPVDGVELVPLRDLARAEVLGEAGGVETEHGLAGFGVLPPLVVAVGDIEVVLEQLAVADVDRLGDHVRVGVLRDGRVQQARMVLPVDVLLDGPSGAPDSDGVEREAMVLDEVLLQHEGGLAAELEVVVRVRAQSRRVDDGVALAQHRLEQHGAGAQRPLVVADGDAALQAEHQAAVPE